jgi:hypothetical protein
VSVMSFKTTLRVIHYNQKIELNRLFDVL